MKLENQSAPVVVDRAYQLALWVLPKVEKFDRSFRFTLGERISAATIDLLTSLTEAAYSTQKDELLENAARRANSVRLLIRLSADLRLLPASGMEHAADRLDEIGRMIAGWRRSRGARP